MENCWNVFGYSDDLGLHRVVNSSNVDTAVTLHLYSPPFDECCIFDEKTGHQNKAKMTFWSKYGKRTPFVSVVFVFFSKSKVYGKDLHRVTLFHSEIINELSECRKFNESFKVWTLAKFIFRFHRYYKCQLV